MCVPVPRAGQEGHAGASACPGVARRSATPVGS